METYFHSVTLDKDKCRGCNHCTQRCPTQAIRVQLGKAKILPELCIDCGECIRVCPHHAKKAVYDKFDSIQNFKYKIALPAPALYGQINNLNDIDYVLTALLHMGFDDVFEVARAAEYISSATRKMMQTGKLKKPVISSACPAVVRLIRIRFPELCEHLLPLYPPMEYAARLARQAAKEKTGLKDGDIGVFFITPCPAKITDIHHSLSSEHSAVNGALAISDIYPALIGKMNKIKTPQPLAQSGMIGLGWARSGGESTALLNNHYLAADGIENCIKVLEEVEDEKLNDIDFIELNACTGGCVGGVLTVENPYVAKTRIQILRKYMPVSSNHVGDTTSAEEMCTENEITPAPVMKLSENIAESMKMMQQIDEIHHRLPGLDCGSCGSPTCRTLAEDIVRGYANETDCVFLLRDRIRSIAGAFNTLNIDE